MWSILFLEPLKWKKHIVKADSQRLCAFFAAMVMSVLRVDLMNVKSVQDLGTRLVKDINVQRLFRTVLELCDFTDVTLSCALQRVEIYVTERESVIRRFMFEALNLCQIRLKAAIKEKKKKNATTTTTTTVVRKKSKSTTTNTTTTKKRKRKKRRLKVLSSKTEAEEKVVIENLMSDNFGTSPETITNLVKAIVRVAGQFVRHGDFVVSSDMMLLWSGAMSKWRPSIDLYSEGARSSVCFVCLNKIKESWGSQEDENEGVFFQRRCRSCLHCPLRWHTRCLNVQNKDTLCPVCSQNIKVRRAIKTLDLLKLETALEEAPYFSPCFYPRNQSNSM